MTTLSGGNQQKVVLARCLMRRLAVLLLDEPTRSVDVRAKAEIYDALSDLAAGGLSILFTTSEMEEAAHCSQIESSVMAQRKNCGRIPRRLTCTDELLFAAVASPVVGASA